MTDTSTCFSCPLCTFVAISIPLILSHLRLVHSSDPNFRVNCGIDVCSTSYRSFSALYQHIYRKHRHCNIIGNRAGPSSNTVASSNRTNGDVLSHVTNEEQDVSPNSSYLSIDDHHDIQHLIGTDIKAEKRSSAIFLLKMKETHFLSQAAIDDIVHGYRDLLEHSLVRLKSHVISQSDTDGDNGELLNNIYSGFQDPFHELETCYKQEKYFKEELGLVEPKQIQVGDSYYTYMFSGSKRRLVERQDSFQYVPLLDSLKALLKDPLIMEQIENPHNRTDDLLEDFCDGELYKSHPLFATDPSAYFDELEICNPLGTHTKVHKLGIVLFMLGNIHPMFRSSLKAMNLAIVVTHPVIEKHGLDSVLKPFLEDLCTLATTGIEIVDRGNICVLKGALLCFLADNMASNAIGGFKESFSFAFRCCRTCLCTTENMSEFFTNESFQPRLQELHEQHCALLNSDLHSHYSKVYGINRRSSLMDVSNYSMFGGGLPHDMMHDLLEGVAQYEIKLLLKHFTSQNVFTLTTFNERLVHFDYGYSESDRPSIVTNRTLQSDDKKLRLTASQTLLLCRILPFLCGDLIPEGNEVWSCFLLLLTIIDIVICPVVSKGHCSFLKLLIEEHLTMFKRLYTDSSIIPKMHFLVHYPQQIMALGPMVRTWTIRQEAKLNFFKRSAHLGNFKNISLTLAFRHQRWFCYYLRPSRVLLGNSSRT